LQAFPVPVAALATAGADTVPGTCAATGTGKACKELGGKACCNRCGTQGFDISPAHAYVGAGTAVTMYFTPHLPSPDAVIYTFSDVSWGDKIEKLPDPVVNNKTYSLTHIYTTKGDYVVRADAGAQHKYEGDGSCSYECCTEGTAIITVQ